MNMPNYTDYSMNQLRDCEKNIDGEKFPDRLEAIKKEIALRTKAGEIESDPSFEEFMATGVPFWVGVKAWWFFTWRSTLFVILSGIAFIIPIILINKIISIPDELLAWLRIIYGLVLGPTIGVLVMMQTLSRRFWGHRIYIRRVDEEYR